MQGHHRNWIQRITFTTEKRTMQLLNSDHLPVVFLDAMTKDSNLLFVVIVVDVSRVSVTSFQGLALALAFVCFER